MLVLFGCSVRFQANSASRVGSFLQCLIWWCWVKSVKSSEHVWCCGEVERSVKSVVRRIGRVVWFLRFCIFLCLVDWFDLVWLVDLFIICFDLVCDF